LFVDWVTARDGCRDPLKGGAVLLAPSLAWQAQRGERVPASRRLRTPVATRRGDRSFSRGLLSRELRRAAKALASPSRRRAHPHGKRRRRRLWANLPLQRGHAMLPAQKIAEKGGAAKRVRPDAWYWIGPLGGVST
jgi:hypothetical protein